MNKNNLTEEQLCKFCYNLCVKCNWDNNKIWREAKRNNMITNDIKYNAKVYMEKYLKISKEEILPDWFDKELDTDNSNKEESEELDKIINSLV